jgi:hypothetical protein
LNHGKRLKKLVGLRFNMSRLDYVKYDEIATDSQAFLKNRFMDLENLIDAKTVSPRAKALAMTKLEECYMWVGKAIRDDQIQRNGSAELQEQRNNS